MTWKMYRNGQITGQPKTRKKTKQNKNKQNKTTNNTSLTYLFFNIRRFIRSGSRNDPWVGKRRSKKSCKDKGKQETPDSRNGWGNFNS